MKVLLFKKNSPWGITKHPVKGNIYNKVLRFDDDKGIGEPSSLRYKFIRKYLAEEYYWTLDLHNKQDLKPIAKNFKSNIKFEIPINIKKDYPTWTRMNAMNIDCAVIYLFDKYYFCTAKFLRWKGNLQADYEFEIDLFFTYQPYKFREGTTNMVQSGHKDRWKLNGNNLEPIIENLLQEEATLALQPTVINSVKIDSNYSVIKNESGIEDVLRNLKIAVFYLRTSTDDLPDLKDTSNLPGKWRREDWSSTADDYDGNLGGTFLTSNSVGGETTTDLPYIIALVPFLQGYSDIKTCGVINNNKYVEFSFDQMFSRYGKGIGTHMEPFSIQILNYVPGLFEFDYVGNCLYIRSKTQGLKFFFSMDKLPNSNEKWNKCGFFKLNNIHENDALLKEWNSKQTINTLLNLPNHTWEYINYQGNKVKRSINDLKNIKFEPKLLSPQFRTYRLLEQGGNFIDYSLWELYGIQSPLKGKFNLSPENFSMSVFSEQNNVNGGSGIHINKSLILSGIRDIPRQGSKFLEYLNNNQSKIDNALYYAKQNENLAIASSSLGIVGSLIGIGASSASKNLTGGLASGAGLGHSIIGSVNAGINKNRSYFTEQSTQRDLKRQPLVSTPIGNKVMSEFMSGPNEIGLFWNILDLNENDKLKGYDYLYRYGYTVKKEYHLTNFLNTRYYFNFVVASDVKNTLETDESLSSLTKQMIDEAYETGITIWHVRDIETFEGIEVFKKENWEINLLNDGENVNLDDLNKTEIDEKQHLILTEKVWADSEFKTYDPVNEIGTESEKTESKPEESTGTDIKKSDYIFIPYQYADQGSTYWRFGLVSRTSGLANKSSLKASDSTIKLNWEQVRDATNNNNANNLTRSLVNKYNKHYDIKSGPFSAQNISKYELNNKLGYYGFTEYGPLGINDDFIYNHQWLNVINEGFNEVDPLDLPSFWAHDYKVSAHTFNLKIWFKKNGKWFSLIWYDNLSYFSGGYWYLHEE